MKILERLRKTNSVRIRVLVPLILALILLLGSMVLISHQSQQKGLEQESAAETRTTEKLFLEYMEEEAKKLSIALSTITLNKELMAAFKAKDRERLHAMTRSYFERLRSHNDVSHLYFTGPDRVNILRLHQPGRYGDRIDRFTTLEAEKTGRESRGTELGPLGTFTLRVVTPWYDGERLLGYVELGMEIEHFLKELQGILGSRVYAFIHKDFMHREEWEAGIRMLGRKEEWGHFPDAVITGGPLDQVPENVAQVIAGKHTLQPVTDVHIDGTYYRVAFIPLMDAGKREVGHISILHDTTARISAFHRSVLFICIFYVLVGTALFVFFYTVLGQIEKELFSAREKLVGEKEALQKSEETIHSLNTELLLKVEERTRQLLATQEDLVRSEKLAVLGQLSGSVGHELRNPLGVMSNAVYFLKTVMTDADETVREYLDIIKQEIDNSERIITDLLDFSRIKPPQATVIPVHELIRQSLKRCAIPENARLQTDVPETLPKVLVDPLQMGQVFQNLITNGIQAMPEGGSLRISARKVLGTRSEERGAEEKNLEPRTSNLEPASDFVEISVADTGEGISPENMKKLFQPLFTTKPRGIGLGLVVCKNLAEINGGRIEVESRLGEGTTFTVTLPVEGE